MNKEIIAEFSIGTDTLVKQATEVKATLDELRAKQKELAKEVGGTSSDAFVKNSAEIKKLNGEYNTYVKTLSLSTTSVNQQSTSQKVLTEEINKSNTSIASARESNKKLLAVRNQLDLSTEKGRKQQALINAEIAKNNAFIKDNVTELEQQKIGIGGYEDAINAALDKTGLFGSSIKGLITDFKNVQGGISSAVTKVFGLGKATDSTTKATKAFRIALISTGIVAIVVVIGALVAAFASTQRGIDAVNKVLAPLQGIFQGLIGVVQDVASNMVDAFSNPKQILTDLLSFLEGQVMNRIGAFKVILEGLINLDFKQVGNGLAQGLTGVENVVGKVNNGLKATGEFLEENANRALEIEALKVAEEKAIIKNTLLQGELNKQIKEQNKLADDTRLSTLEREAAAVRSVELSKELLASEQSVLDIQIERQLKSNEFNDTSREDELKVAELQKKRNEKETQALKLQTTQQNKVNTIRNQGISQAKKAQDEAIKQQETQLKLLQLVSSQETQSLSDKQKGLQDVLTKELAIIDAKQKAGLSADEAEIMRLEARQSALDSNTALILDAANKELEIYLLNNQHILDNEDNLNAELIAKKKQLIDEKARLELEALNAEGLSKDEYNAKRDEIERNRISENNEQDKVAKQIKKEEDKVQDQIDYEEKIALLIERDATQLEYDTLKRETERERQIQQINEDVEDETLRKVKIDNLNAKFDAQDLRRKKLLNDQKLSLASDTLGGISELLGKETKAGKVAAVAQAAINTYQGVTQVWRSPSTLPEPFATAQKVVSTGIVLGSGFKAVNQIKNTKAAKGISFQGTLNGASHANGGIDLGNGIEAEGGENLYTDGNQSYIVNKKASSFINKNGILGALSHINQNIGGGIPLSTPTNYASDGGNISQNLRQRSKINFPTEEQQTIKVINIAQDTADVVNDAIQVENMANL